MTSDDGAIESTAIEACLAGGRYLRAAFRSGDTDVTYLDHDVKSSADTGAEERMLEVVRSAFPDHRIYAEESGVHAGDDRYEWIVDPLDGTNDFEAGLPTFASAITVLAGDEPRLGVVYVPIPDDLYVGERGEGVRYNGRPVRAVSDVSPGRATVVSVIGHAVKRDPDRRATAEAIDRAVERRCKRRLESWSPTVHWGLLARGRLDGIVCYRPDREEQRLGELFARESGLRTRRGEDWFVGGANAELVESLTDAVEEVA